MTLATGIAVVSTLTLLSTAFVPRVPSPEGASASPGQPNMVVIVTDDQRWDTLWALPIVRSELVQRGVTFKNAFAVTPLCCPSRATILTGRYAHSTGVYRNEPPMGGWRAFDDGSTIATWLDAAGYRTALIGKYLNGYESEYVPPGWDHWVAFSGDTAYYEYSLNHDGQVVHHGSDPSDYSTDVLAGEADRFIRSTPDTQPLLLYFTPWAPHAPATPAPRHDDVLTDLEPWRPPSFNEPDVSDKPAYIRDLPLLDPYKQGTIDRLRPDMYRSLLAVDDAVGTIVAALEDEGRLDTTMIVFLSDNGFLWGEHRWPAKWGKSVPYEESIRIPLVVRYDPMTEPGRRIARLVANVDIAPTLARLAGVAAPGAEGRSLLRLIDGRVRDWRPAVLIEYLRRWSPTPTYCGIRTRSHLYVFYEPAEEELYALRHDPYQLTDRADDPSLSGLVSRLRAMLAELCDPPPPGLTLPTP